MIFEYSLTFKCLCVYSDSLLLPDGNFKYSKVKFCTELTAP